MRVVVDDGDIHLTADVSGEGPLVVCHPGFGRWGRDFESVRSVLLTAGRRVALFDPRGVGESTGPLDDLTMHDLATDVLRVARQLGTAPFDLVGHAFGNRVVRCAAADAPDEVGRIASIAAGGSVPAAPGAYAALQRAMNLELSQVERLAALQESLFAPGNDPTSWLDGWHAIAVAAQARRCARHPRVTGSTRGGRGCSSCKGSMMCWQFRPTVATSSLGSVRCATLVEIADAGHAMLPEQPLAIANALIDFFGPR